MLLKENFAKAVLNPYTKRSKRQQEYYRLVIIIQTQSAVRDKTGKSLQVLAQYETRTNAVICTTAKLDVTEGIGIQSGA